MIFFFKFLVLKPLPLIERRKVKRMEQVLSSAQTRPRLSKVSLEALTAIWRGLSTNIVASLHANKVCVCAMCV